MMARPALLLVIAAVCCLWCLPAHAGKEDRDFISAEAAYREGSYRKALSKLEDFLEAYPQSRYRAQALFYAGESAYEAEKYSIARRHYDDLLTAFPDSPMALRARHARALALAEEGRDADAVEALLEVAPLLEDPGDRVQCYRRVVRTQMDRRKYTGALEALGLLLDVGADWREVDDHTVEVVGGAAIVEELLAFEETRRGTSGAGLALYCVLLQKGLTEIPETDSELVLLFSDEYSAHPFASRIEAMRTGGLTSPARADRIGVILPLSGDYHRPGNDVLDGINLALLDLPRQDIEVQLVVRDSEGDPDKAVAALQELVDDEHVIAVIGPLLSANAEPVAQRAEELRVPIVVLSQKDGIPQTGRYVFRNFLTPQAQVSAIVGYAVDHYGFRRFGIVYPTTERGGLMAELFWAGVEARGCEVTAIEPYSIEDTDFRKPLRKLYGLRYLEKGIGADDLELPFLTDRFKPQLPDGRAVQLTPGDDFQAVWVPDNTKRVSMIAPAMVHQDINLADTYQEKPPVTLLGGASLNNDDFVHRGQRYVRGTLFVDAFFRASPDPTTVEFVTRFKDAHERDPGLLEALAYDTTRALLTCIGDGATNRPGLRRALAAYEPVATVTGETGFDTDGDMQRDLLLLTVQEGGIVQLYPVPPPADLLAPLDEGAPAE